MDFDIFLILYHGALSKLSREPTKIWHNIRKSMASKIGVSNIKVSMIKAALLYQYYYTKIMCRRINPIFDFENQKFAIFGIQFLNGL